MGATVITSPNGCNAAASAVMPSECTPSSFVIKIRSMRELYPTISGGTIRHNDEQENRGGDREERAGEKRDCRSEHFPQHPEYDTRHKRADAGDRVVDPECRPFLRR